MLKWMSRRSKIITAAIAGGIVILFCVWAASYFAIFKPDPFENGAVVVNEDEAKMQPAPVPYVVDSFIESLDVPWGIVFTSADRALVSERNGKIRVIQNETLISEPLLSFPEVSSEGEEGLMGIALDPEYAQNRQVYACLAVPSSDAYVVRVVRFEDNGNSTGALTTVIDNIPAAQYHAGCRLQFGPDQKLYVTTGDATNKDIAQDVNSLGGKVLRANADGSVPDDNPFSGSLVWSLGHRNPQGIAFQPGTGQLFETEHGPSIFDGPAGGDEVNIVQKGANYGWPTVSHDQSDPRFVSPLLEFTPAVAPAGATFYRSTVFPQFTNNFFFSGLKGEGLYRVVLSASNQSEVVLYEKLADVNVGRIRDVIEGPDGYIYFLSSNTDGRGELRAGDDHVYRLIPQTYWQEVESP